jgi:hypothetical protein
MSDHSSAEAGVAAGDQKPAEDLALLRKTDSALEKQLSNLSLIRLALFIVITFLFASAIHRRNDDAISRAVVQVHASVDKEDVSKLALDPISVYLSLNNLDDFTVNGQPNTALSVAMDELKSQYQQIFTVKFSVVGTDLSFDLRLIIVTFPLWLSIAQIYISIIREKRRILRSIGREISTKDSAHVSAVDALMFGPDEGAFRSYPGKLVNGSFWAVVATLIGLMVWITGIHTTDEGRVLVRLGVIVVLCSAFYSAAFSSWVSTRLREQVKARLGYELSLDRFGRFWANTHRILCDLPTRMRPRLTLIVAGILTISTLVLQTAQLGCEDDRETVHHTSAPASGNSAKLDGQPRPGYQIFTGAADWPPSVITAVDYAIIATEDRYGLGLYGFALLLAIFGIGVAPFLRRTRKLLVCLSYASAFLSVAFVCEFANQPLILWIFWPATVLIIVATWITARIVRRKWPSFSDLLDRSLRMGSVPLLIADVAFLISVGRILPGLVLLFFCVHLLTLGYFSARAEIAGHMSNLVVDGSDDGKITLPRTSTPASPLPPTVVRRS